MNDYLTEVEVVKERNNKYSAYHLNENVARNVRDNCLPLDYFTKRILSMGICHSMAQVRDLLKLMGSFENAGHQTFSATEIKKRQSFLETLQLAESGFARMHSPEDKFKMVNDRN